MQRIDDFRGPHRWLSNFFPCEVSFDGEVYASTEAAYQAAKTTDLSQRAAIRAASRPGDAKRLGQRIKLRDDWEQIKLSVMEDLVRQKFSGDQELKEALLGTGDAELVEGNRWNDVFWGVCRGQGQNHLGKILMKVRAELRS